MDENEGFLRWWYGGLPPPDVCEEGVPVRAPGHAAAGSFDAETGLPLSVFSDTRKRRPPIAGVPTPA